MKLTDIEDLITKLASRFERERFAADFLAAYGRTETEIRQLLAHAGKANKSDQARGVLIPRQIHLVVCEQKPTQTTMQALQNSAATLRHKPVYLLATDGEWLLAENLSTGKQLDCSYAALPEHFLFFAELAGIRLRPEISETDINIRATTRLNKLYIELLTHNPDWASPPRRHAMNHFMARLIFCLFAEDTDIFPERRMFTRTLELHGDKDGSNTHEIIAALFRAMNTRGLKWEQLPYRTSHNLPPYVNGGLFAQDIEIPRFSRMARNYLLEIGRLSWSQINPDIFGSMIQAIADKKERSHLGLHYTSLPNIHKVLDPLFLDGLREQLISAGKDRSKLKALLTRISRIRVLDPACGSGNFLVAAYKALRGIEANIHQQLGTLGTKDGSTRIRLSNFRGIEIQDFPAEVARLSLIIAQYQCDHKYQDQRKFLPLDSENSILCANALDKDWFEIIPPVDVEVANRLHARPKRTNGAVGVTLDTANTGGETYICGNPPYVGSTWQTAKQKADLAKVFDDRIKTWKSLDYVSAWFMMAADYCALDPTSAAAFVATNSVCQGQQVSALWPAIFKTGNRIRFAHTSFKWSNHATHNAGVTVVVVGLSANAASTCRLFSEVQIGKETIIAESNPEEISAYLTAGASVIVSKASKPLFGQSPMLFGNKPVDGGHLLLTQEEVHSLDLSASQRKRFVRPFMGSSEFIKGQLRFCLWIEDRHLAEAMSIPAIASRIDGVRAMRLDSPDAGAKEMAKRPHQMREMNVGRTHTIVVPAVSSEHRDSLPCGIVPRNQIISNRCYALYDGPLWNLALLLSRLHWVWVGSVCARLETRFSYSNTLGWNTFPIPPLSEQDKAKLTRCAEDILLAREAHFPATIADLYAPGKMPANLQKAHAQNDEVLEKLYNDGQCFASDSDRLSKLFAMYAERMDSLSLEKAGKARVGAIAKSRGKRHLEADTPTDARALASLPSRKAAGSRRKTTGAPADSAATTSVDSEDMTTIGPLVRRPTASRWKAREQKF